MRKKTFVVYLKTSDDVKELKFVDCVEFTLYEQMKQATDKHGLNGKYRIVYRFDKARKS